MYTVHMPYHRIGYTMPYPASLRNFYAYPRRHRGEMSLICTQATATTAANCMNTTREKDIENRCLTADTAAGAHHTRQRLRPMPVQRTLEPNANHGMTASPIARECICFYKLVVLMYVKISSAKLSLSRQYTKLIPMISNYLTPINTKTFTFYVTIQSPHRRP